MIAKDALQNYINRIERLAEEKAALTSDINDLYAEAADNGFDKKAMRAVIKLRKLERAEREQQEEMVQLYLNVLEGGNVSVDS